MCNIAGYIGNKSAAPILIEMMKKQEGFGGGFYTGLSIHDGKRLQTVKVVGNLDNLLNETDAASFSGSVGFLHSRSNSGGNIAWGQPFTSNEGDISYIANGVRGDFLTEELLKERQKVATCLWNEGYIFRSKVEGQVGTYLQPLENVCIHDSEFMCQYIASLIAQGLTVDAAMSRAISTFPTEIVALVLREQNPGRIFVSRMNYPMMIGIAEDGDTYLATTAMAFPERVKFRSIESLPPLSTCEVFRGGFRMSEVPITVMNVASVTPEIWSQAYIFLENYLIDKKEEPKDMDTLIELCDGFWEKGKTRQGAFLVYEILRAFQKQGRLQVVKCAKQGAFDGYSMEEFRVYITEV